MIRELDKNEVNEVYDFVEEVLNTEKDAWLKEAKKGILSYFGDHKQEYQYFISEEKSLNGVLVYEPSDFRILFLLVKQEYRHQDIGSSLLDALKEKASTFHISRVVVNAYGNQKDFYLSNGFEIEGDINSDGGITVISMEYLVDRNNLGKKVTVVIDRPYGSLHPTLSDVEYPYNYGFIKEDITDDDIEFQDAYVVGIEEPVDEFTGYVIGIVYHKNDSTSKWIVAPGGMEIKPDEIIQLLGIEEQFYDTRFVWSK